MGKETYKLKHHQHCVDLLDLAIKAKNIVAENTRKRDLYNSLPIRDKWSILYTANDYQKEIDRYQPIYERILKSYDVAMDKLNSIN